MGYAPSRYSDMLINTQYDWVADPPTGAGSQVAAMCRGTTSKGDKVGPGPQMVEICGEPSGWLAFCTE
jgi:hypothetical protein